MKLMEPNIDVAADAADTQPVRIQAAGQRYWAGDMRAINTTLPLTTIVKLAADQAIWRKDFELGSKKPGNRPVDPTHVNRIKTAITENTAHLMLGAAILAVHPDAIQVEGPWPDAEAGKLVDTRVFGLKAGYDMFTIDFQHRKEAIVTLYDEIVKSLAEGRMEFVEVERILRKTSIPVIICLEADPDVITHLFVSLASVKPIPAALIVAMDHFDPVNRLGLNVSRRWKLLAKGTRLEYLRGTPRGDNLYSAAAMRSAVANILIGFNDRNPEQRRTNIKNELHRTYGKSDDDAINRVTNWMVQNLDYAADKLPGWRDLAKAKTDEEFDAALSEFKQNSLLRSASGLAVVAGVIAASRAAGLDAKKVIDAMADAESGIPFRRSDTRRGKDRETGTVRVRHRFFEGTLAKTELVEKEDGSLKTVYKSPGGGRANYEAATVQVLKQIAKDPNFAEIASRKVLETLGLVEKRGPGRPRSVSLA